MTTDRWIDLNRVLDLHVILPGGTVSFLVVSRRVGDHVVGASIFAVAPEDEMRWAAVYRHLSERRA